MVLFISNGTSEDMMGATIARNMSPEIPKKALSLVGLGKAYGGVAEFVGPRKVMPSHGFIFNSFKNAVDDLKAGFISMTLEQWRVATEAGREAKAIVVVGEAYALMVAKLLAGPNKPVFHVALNVTAYYWENLRLWDHLSKLNQLGVNLILPHESLIHRRIHKVYLRDAVTAAYYKNQRGVPNAEYLGSFAMDIMAPPERSLEGLLDGRPVLALMPGTREDIYFGTPLMLEAARLTPQFQAIVTAVRPPDQMGVGSDWEIRQLEPTVYTVSKEGYTAWFIQGAFSAVLHKAHLAVGIGGAANEQAAGLGIPVVGFPTPGPQFIPSFAERQKRLMGDSLIVCEPTASSVAHTLNQLHTSPEWYSRASKAGKERIGAPGALPRIAKEVEAVL